MSFGCKKHKLNTEFCGKIFHKNIKTSFTGRKNEADTEVMCSLPRPHC